MNSKCRRSYLTSYGLVFRPGPEHVPFRVAHELPGSCVERDVHLVLAELVATVVMAGIGRAVTTPNQRREIDFFSDASGTNARPGR